MLRLKDGVALDHEAADSVEVTVTATDAGGLSTSETFDITVTDVNETPTAIALSAATVAENAAGAVIGTLTVNQTRCRRQPWSGRLRHPLRGGRGVLRLKDGVALDHEAADSVEVTVTATDAGGLSTSETFDITVTDVNETPTRSRSPPRRWRRTPPAR